MTRAMLLFPYSAVILSLPPVRRIADPIGQRNKLPPITVCAGRWLTAEAFAEDVAREEVSKTITVPVMHTNKGVRWLIHLACLKPRENDTEWHLDVGGIGPHQLPAQVRSEIACIIWIR